MRVFGIRNPTSFHWTGGAYIWFYDNDNECIKSVYYNFNNKNIGYEASIIKGIKKVRI